MCPAVRTESGNLKLIVWDIAVANNGTASVVRLGDANAGAVSALSISRARNFHGVFTAVRDSENRLKVIPWKLTTDGATLTRGAFARAGVIGKKLDVAPLAQGVAAAVQDADGDLRVITWSANSAGNIGARRDTVVAGDVAEIRLVTAPHGGSNLTAALRSSTGKLLLVGFAVNNNGTDLRRIGSSRAGAASKISIDVVSRSYPGLDPRDMTLTGLRDASGDLKLVSWDTNLVNP